MSGPLLLRRTAPNCSNICYTWSVILGLGVSPMRRRDFIALLGSSVAGLPLAARSQQPAMPVIGFLAEGAPDSEPGALTAFRQGLREAGYVEGQNVQIDYRWTGNQRDLVLALTADLVRRDVTVIYSARGSAVAQAAKSATTTIPIVFTNGGDPVKLGLVASLNRPGGNVTGTTFFSNVLTAKRLTLLRDLMPSAVDVAVLINPTNANADTDRDELQAAAQAPGLRLKLLPATNEKEIDAAFAAMAQDRPAALFVAADAGNPGGSPEATRRAFNKRFLLDLAEDWQQHGREVFKRVRRESPAAYLKVCAMLVPREMKVDHSGGVKAMTDEQIEATIEAIQAMLEQRAGEAAKVIKGTAETVALPAPNVVPDGPNKVMDAPDTAVGPRECKPRKVPSPPGT